jgi:hypothetical protein
MVQGCFPALVGCSPAGLSLAISTPQRLLLGTNAGTCLDSFTVVWPVRPPNGVFTTINPTPGVPLSPERNAEVQQKSTENGATLDLSRKNMRQISRDVAQELIALGRSSSNRIVFLIPCLGAFLLGLSVYLWCLKPHVGWHWGSIDSLPCLRPLRC